jgi:hypothetical protein
LAYQCAKLENSNWKTLIIGSRLNVDVVARKGGGDMRVTFKLYLLTNLVQILYSQLLCLVVFEDSIQSLPSNNIVLIAYVNNC